MTLLGFGVLLAHTVNGGGLEGKMAIKKETIVSLVKAAYKAGFDNGYLAVDAGPEGANRRRDVGADDFIKQLEKIAIGVQKSLNK